VIRVKDHKPKTQKPLEQVKQQIKSKVVNDNARKKVKEIATSTLEKMRAAETSEVAKGMAAKEFKAVWKKQDKLTRNDTKLDRSIVSKVFKTKKPDAGKPNYDMVQLANGDVALFALNKVENGDISKLDDAKKTSSKRSLSSISSNELFEEYMNELKSKADIVKFEDRL
jgi:peptidyl-prolyl cis-trans isomerase D